MNMQVVLNQMIELFLLLGVGYFLYKIHIIDNVFNGKLNQFVLCVAIPCMILNSAFFTHCFIHIFDFADCGFSHCEDLPGPKAGFRIIYLYDHIL